MRSREGEHLGSAARNGNGRQRAAAADTKRASNGNGRQNPRQRAATADTNGFFFGPRRSPGFRNGKQTTERKTLKSGSYAGCSAASSVNGRQKPRVFFSYFLFSSVSIAANKSAWESFARRFFLRPGCG